MNIKLKAELINDGKAIKVSAYNNTLYPLPPEIYSMELNVFSSTISNPDGIIGLDVRDYIFNRRIYDEIYIITSGELGFGDAEEIRDGVYTLELVINGHQSFTNKFASLYQVYNKLVAVTDEQDYEVKNISEEFVEMQSDKSIGKTEEIRLALNLYEAIVIAAWKSDEVAINNRLNELNRILKIIKN